MGTVGHGLRSRWLLEALGALAVFAVILAACGGTNATPSVATPSPQATATPVATGAAATVAPTVILSLTPTPPAPVATVATVILSPTPTPPAPTATVSRPTAPPTTPTPAGPEPKYGGTFRGRNPGDLRAWDSRAPDGSVFFTMQPILSPLMYTPPDDPSRLVGDLAESWEFSRDGLVLTFHLRKGVKWQDGTAFTSKDVIFTLDKFINPGDPGLEIQKSRLAAVSAFAASDDQTVRLTLFRPSASLMAVLSSPTSLIYPAHVPFMARTWTEKPVGTGPYQFQSYRAGDSTKYIKNPGWWKKDAAGRTLPYLDALEMYPIVDRALSSAAFQAGRLDLLEMQAQEKPIPGAKYFLLKAATQVSLQFRNKPPFDNLKVRQAMHVAIDRSTVNAAALEGTGYFPPALLLPVPVGGQWALPDDEVLKLPGFRDTKAQDRVLAQQLLRDSGVDPSTIRPNVLCLNFSPYPEIATLLLSDLAQLGIKANLVAASNTTAAQEKIAGTFDLSLEIYGGTLDDPDDVLIAHVATSGGRNYGRWSSRDIDDLAARESVELDPAKRRALVQDLQRKLYDLATEVPLAYAGRGFSVQSYVEGFRLKRALPSGSANRFDETWLNR